MLAAGWLETALKRYLKSTRSEVQFEHANLRALLRLLQKQTRLVKMQQLLGVLNSQRSYLAHNIHALLSDWIEETVLERSDLLDSHVSVYCERARQLTENLHGLSEIVEKENPSA